MSERPRMVVGEIDYTQAVLENLHLPLFDAWRANLGAQGAVMRGKTFRRCLIEGPAVLLPLEHCTFDGCDFGQALGDVRNLVLRPAGAMVTGAIVVADCLFEGCTFLSVGFTGDTGFLDALTHLTPRAAS